ncbi:MAG: branched-chain amino acid ABC transporter permease [Burkholderiales bacterium]|nr:branched-chain amino acid ABC transporter permease [Burkholderiales bacterium]
MSAPDKARHLRGVVAALVVLALLAAVPFGLDKFAVQFTTRVLIMALFASSLNLIVGYGGMVSLGHAAFFGVAGYVLAFAAPDYEAANLWISLALATAVAALLAAAIGALVLRTRGVYLIMVTLAFGQMLFHLFHDGSFSGGSDGRYIYVRPSANLFGWTPFDLDRHVHLYYLVLALFTLAVAGMAVMLQSPFGRALQGIRVNENRMRALGFATYRYKLVAFTLSGALAGVAGYLAALQFGVVNPEMLGWHLSGSALMMVILGGMGTLFGPALGAAVLLLMELGFQALTKHWQLLTGAVVVGVALLLPRGLAGIARLATRAADD